MKNFKEWLALLACASLLAACGGGGGSPGTNGNGTTPSKAAAAVVLTASAPTIDSSGLDGTEVTLTAIVKDANNNVLPNQTVSFKASSGNISTTVRVTDSNGSVTEKLNVKGDASVRTITVTASVGSVTSAPVEIKVVAVPSPILSLSLTSDSGVLPSAGAAGTEITLVALVKDSSNNVVPGVKVSLAADSGSLTLGTRTTDSKGIVTEKLSTGGDPTSRPIKVTASVVGTTPVSTSVNVTGNKLQINASSTVNVGSSTDVTIKLVDSLGNALNNRAVTFSAAINGLAVKGGGAAVTNTAGQLILAYSATSIGSGNDLITVRAAGETTTLPIAIGSSNFFVNVVNGAGVVQTLANVNTCQIVAIHSDTNGVPQTGTVTVSSSRGLIYSDAACTAPLNTALTLTGGNATAYLQASGPGVATLNATTTANKVTVQGVVEFVAPLTASATVSLQADPAVVGANTVGSTAQQTTLRAVVRDGTAQNNLVKNAQVAFSILTDPSGGSLTQPSVVTTGSDGTASLGYIAGTTDTQLDGVQIQAQVQGVAAKAIAKLTVAKRSLFISAGTGATVGTPNSATYQVDYVVFVTDATGNPVPGVNVTGSVLPRNYYKGRLYFLGSEGPWQFDLSTPGRAPIMCENEDKNFDGLLSANEDYNNNGRLDPGIPITVTPTATTNAGGQAIVSLTYPRDRANWLDVDLTIRGQVSGTEARYVGYVRLPGLGSDYANVNIAPPGQESPYGTALNCADSR